MPAAASARHGPAPAVVDWPDRVPEVFRGAAVAIGNFDGVHLGHQAVIAACLGRDAPIGVLTFEPHPRSLFRPEDPPFRLTPWDAKCRRLGAAGVEFVVRVPFDASFAAWTAEAFIRRLLLDDLAVRRVAIGHDFCFGVRRSGTPALLAAELGARGIPLSRVEAISAPDGGICSSTRIRTHLEAGEPEPAASLLGAPWEIEGPVTEGDRRGRTLGFPTANIPLGAHLRPRFGVYAVSVCRSIGDEAEVWRPGVANIGSRPTVDGHEPRLEAHLFDFSGDLYGQVLRVRLHAFLRPEQRFGSLDALTVQIAADTRDARARLAGVA